MAHPPSDRAFLRGEQQLVRLVDRSRSSSILTAILRPNRALVIVLPIVAGLLAVTLLWQPARDPFGFAAVDPIHLAVPPMAGLMVLITLEVVKPLWRDALRRGATAREIARSA